MAIDSAIDGTGGPAPSIGGSLGSGGPGRTPNPPPVLRGNPAPNPDNTPPPNPDSEQRDPDFDKEYEITKAQAIRTGGNFLYWDLVVTTGLVPGLGALGLLAELSELAELSGTLNNVLGLYDPSSFLDDYVSRVEQEPLIIDLDGNGVSWVSGQSTFDIDGDSYHESTSWIGSDDALLVVDWGNDGWIDRREELTFAVAGGSGMTDLQRLANYDSNHDGVLDVSDAGFGSFKLWRDLDNDGVSDPGELFDLADYGVTSIDLTGSTLDPGDPGVSFWFDTNGDGFIDPDELYDTAHAPEGAIPAQVGGDGTVLESTTVTTTSGTLAAYDVGLDFYPRGAQALMDGDDIVVSYDDGSVDRYLIADDSGGASADLTGTNYAGAFGGEDDDELGTSGPRAVLLAGGDGDDTLAGGSGDDVIDGGDGADELSGGMGNDILLIDATDLAAGVSGGADLDTAVVETTDAVNLDLAATGFEIVFGNDGDDTFVASTATKDVQIYGGAGDDSLTGGSGDDALSGDAGSDQLSGGAGDDILTIDADDTSVDGGDGFDSVFVSSADAVTLDVAAADVEAAFGGDGNDVFDAGDSTDAVILDGGAGGDTLTGGASDDRLMGGGGNDALDGGAGRDVAVFGGDAADYQVTGDHISATVTDLNTDDGDDGTDTLDGIELLVFADSTVHLDGSNNAPIVQDEIWRLRNGDTGFLLGADGLLENDWDYDSDHLKVAAISNVRNGEASLASTGDVTFTADSSFVGEAAFDYRIEEDASAYRRRMGQRRSRSAPTIQSSRTLKRGRVSARREIIEAEYERPADHDLTGSRMNERSRLSP